MDPPVVVVGPLDRVAVAARLLEWAGAQHPPPSNPVTGAATPEPTHDAPMDPLPLDPLEALAERRRRVDRS